VRERRSRSRAEAMADFIFLRERRPRVQTSACANLIEPAHQRRRGRNAIAPARLAGA